MARLGFGDARNDEDALVPAFLAIPLGLAALAMAGFLAYVGVKINIHFAQEEGVAWELVAAYAFADVGEFVCPFLLGAVAWGAINRTRLTVFWVVCVVTSVMCVVATTSEIEARKADAMRKAREALAAAHQSKTAAEAVLARPEVLAETGDVAQLTVIVADAKAAADREALRGGCGTQCEKLYADHRKLSERLNNATSHTKARTDLTNANKLIQERTVQQPGIVLVWAGPLGADPDVMEKGYRMGMSLAPLLIIKIAVMALVPVGAFLAFRAWRKRQAPVIVVRRPVPGAGSEPELTMAGVHNQDGRALPESGSALGSALHAQGSSFGSALPAPGLPKYGLPNETQNPVGSQGIAHLGQSGQDKEINELAETPTAHESEKFGQEISCSALPDALHESGSASHALPSASEGEGSALHGHVVHAQLAPKKSRPALSVVKDPAFLARDWLTKNVTRAVDGTMTPGQAWDQFRDQTGGARLKAEGVTRPLFFSTLRDVMKQRGVESKRTGSGYVYKGVALKLSVMSSAKT